jgi:hypothetical protein
VPVPGRLFVYGGFVGAAVWVGDALAGVVAVGSTIEEPGSASRRLWTERSCFVDGSIDGAGVAISSPGARDIGLAGGAGEQSVVTDAIGTPSAEHAAESA